MLVYAVDIEQRNVYFVDRTGELRWQVAPFPDPGMRAPYTVLERHDEGRLTAVIDWRRVPGTIYIDLRDGTVMRER